MYSFFSKGVHPFYEQNQKLGQQRRPVSRSDGHGGTLPAVLQLPRIRNLDRDNFMVTPETVNQLLNTIS